LQDANYFVVAFREVIESSIPHIYLSALPSSHRTSKVAEVFTAKYPSTIKVTAHGIQHRPKQVVELRGHTSEVNSVCFSADGTRIVSGS
jgi:WD40 repeat protein